jgi:hypothetical protein
MLAILAGALWFFGEGIRTGGTALQGTQVSQAMEAVNSAEVVVQAGAGEMRIDALDGSGDLVRGTVPADPRQQVRQDYRVEGDRAIYSLRTSGADAVATGQTYTWDLGLNPGVPLDLQFDLGAGDMELDLETLTVESLDVDLGVGEVQVRLPEAGQYTARVKAAIGSIKILAPAGLGVRIHEDAALVSVNVPDGYQQDGGTYTSPGYETAAQRVDLTVNLAIGSIVVEQP